MYYMCNQNLTIQYVCEDVTVSNKKKRSKQHL